jgi:deoxyadenosine/deoxycytidine kinase
LEYSYIVIEGNIGAGKTSLASRLSLEMNTALILEQFEENSFLPKFYEDPSRYAFPLELSFLADRYQQLKNHFTRPELFTSRTIADYFIFKSLIFARQNLEPAEFSLYNRLFQIISSIIPKPDLVVYLFLEPQGLKENIIKRGRSYEQNISLEYLGKIQQGYLDFLKQQKDFRIVLINTSGLDFVGQEEDYSKIKVLMEREWLPGMHVIERQ